MRTLLSAHCCRLVKDISPSFLLLLPFPIFCVIWKSTFSDMEQDFSTSYLIGLPVYLF